MSIGLIIKYERLKQDIKQTNLAKGICSISYLSKIEHNLVEPNPEIIELLLSRLNIKSKIILESENFIKVLQDLYKDAVLNRDKTKIEEFLKNISNSNELYLEENFLLCIVYKFRLDLIAERELAEMELSVRLMESIKNNNDNNENFILNLNLGLYYYLVNKYVKSLEYLLKAQNIAERIAVDDWELADLYNVLSLCYFENNLIFDSEYYANKALEYYRNNLILNRAIDCYILLGNVMKRKKDCINAYSNYQLALKISKDLSLVRYEGIIYQNLGSLSSYEGKSKEALQYYFLSLNCKKVNSSISSYLVTVLSIIKEYSKNQDNINVIKWCNKGIGIINEAGNLGDSFEYYYIHFKVYKAISENACELEGILKSAIKFFEEQRDLRHISKYSISLARYYDKQNKLKASTMYYKKSINALLMKDKITRWEDI